MMTYVVDTNSILDLCYRYYPKSLFTPVWDSLQSAVIAGHVRFVITQHIHSEIYRKAQTMRFNTAKLDEFRDMLKVDTVSTDQYSNALSDILAELTDLTDIKPETLVKNSDDLSNICVALSMKATVITAEQSSGKAITQPDYKRLKIPDTCQYYQVDCGNWIPLFEFIGLVI
nr:DUF4411 family protein [Moraxella sp.]